MGRQYNDLPPGRKRDEFQWEQELRRDDCRISCYFRELPLCLDLPGEDEMIFENMQSYPGLITAGALPGRWRLWDEPDFDRAREEEPEREMFPVRNGGVEWLERLDRMQVEWNLLAAREMDEGLTRIFLAVSCAFGKTQVHWADFEDTALREFLPLKLCLGKRIIEDINELVNMLRAAASICKHLTETAEAFTESLLLAREYLTDRLAELRRSPDAV